MQNGPLAEGGDVRFGNIAVLHQAADGGVLLSAILPKVARRGGY